MIQDHDHHARSPDYYLEQLCTIGICGALGATAIGLYLTNKLNLLLVPSLHAYVIAGGGLLLFLVLVRSAAVWRSVRKHAASHADKHDHTHCGHGHDHGWAPWRYVVLMLPVVLFCLNLPKEGLGAAPVDLKGFEINKKVAPRGVLQNVGFQQLERAAYQPNERDALEGRQVSLIGQFSGEEPKRFGLMRYKMGCCPADAIQLTVAIGIDPDPKVPGVDVAQMRGKWLQVTGLIQFFQPPRGVWKTAIIVQPEPGQTLDDLIEVIPPPPEPFLY